MGWMDWILRYTTARLRRVPAERSRESPGSAVGSVFDMQQYDTHAATSDANISRNLGYNRNEWTTGLSYHVAPGAVVKADYQILDNAIDGNESSGQLNLGFGVWF